VEEIAAKSWLVTELGVPRETLDRIDLFVELLRAENFKQNLVAGATLEAVWTRHVLDSAQLLKFAPAEGSWLDLGSGAGFPGLIVAALWNGQVTLVESRKLRVDFLTRAAEAMKLVDCHIIGSRLEIVESLQFDVISARAFAPLDRLLSLAERFAAPTTRWILPKGRSAASELEGALTSWQGEFHMEQSVTDADAGIIVASNVRRRGKEKRRG
jgi:16S rRNA (guanine527-N7)-methyltransferase